MADEKDIGRRTLVTGGSSGLGAAVVELCTKRGDRVHVLDVRTPPADVAHHQVDLSDRVATERAVADACTALGGLDAVVTAAGIDACGRLDEVDAAAWERVIAVNLLGTVAVVRAALPALSAARGHVVTVASTLALRGLSDATAYCASKFGVLGFSRALSAETQGRVSVTCLLPGGMNTSFFDDRPEQYRPGPDAVLNDPLDVARAVLYAMEQPPGCVVRELVVCPAHESSWP